MVAAKPARLVNATAHCSPEATRRRAGAVAPPFPLPALCVLAAGVVMIGLAGVGIAPLRSSLFLICGLVSVGNGFSMPNGFAGAVSVDPSRAGAASGLSGALQMGIGAALMTVVGHTLSDTPLPVILMMLIGATLAWLAHLHGMKTPA